MADYTIPKGCDNPLVYVIAGFPKDEDFVEGYPLSGAPGSYLLRILSAYDVFDRVRIINICPNDSGVVDPNYIINDLASLKCKPNVIVTLSSDVTRMILGPKFTTISAMQGNVYKSQIAGIEYDIVPAYSPSWILEELRLASEEDKFTKAPSEFAKSMYVVSALAKGTYTDVIASKKMTYCLTFDEFLNEYLSKGYVNEEKLAYDVETTAEPIMNENLQIIGFSNARKNEGYYVCIEALDYKMSEEDKFKTFSLLKDILMSQKVIVHNSMYERPLTLECVGYDIPYETLDDTLAMARLMLGGHVGAGLKAQAQTHCGYTDWETDTQVYLSAASGIINAVYNKFYDKSEFPNIDSMSSYSSSNKWKSNFDESLDKFKSICYKYYNVEEVNHLIELIIEKGRVYADKKSAPPKVLPYSFIPYRIICKYGALDSIATVDIYDHYTNWMRRESTPEVDLFKGYEIILKQMYAGYILERNGIYWNEEVARGRQEIWEATCVENLKSMIKSPYLKESMIDNNIEGYLPLVLSRYYPEVAMAQGFKVDYDDLTHKYKVYKFDGNKYKHVAKSYLWDIKISQEIRDMIYNLLVEDVDKYTSREQLSSVYNPSSVKENDIALKILYTEDAKIAMYLDRLAIYARSIRYNYKLKSIFDSDIDRDVIQACHYISTCLDEISNWKNDRNVRWSLKKAKIAELEASIETNKLLILKNDRIRNMVYNGASLFDDPSIVEPFDPEVAMKSSLSFSNFTYIQAISDTMMCDDLDDMYLKLANDIWDVKTLKSNYGEEWYKERGNLFKQFRELYLVAKPHSAKLLSMMKESEITSMNEGAIIQMYVVYQYMGIDADNPLTWTDRYKWLIEYRIYKKLLKLITAYLEGRVGRGSVYMVDKKALSSGDNCVLRGRWFDRYAPISEDYLLASSWAVATADTLRWRSGMHVIPWGSPIKKFYTSRFRGGTILAPDYSQMEVRALAGSSKDKNMIDAFARGLDFHRNTAALAFRKAPEEVTDAERRFMKMACRPGNAKVKLLDGRVMTLKEMYDSGKKDYWTYSWDVINEKMVPGRVVDVQRTKKVTKLVRVKFTNGLYDECTDNHPYLRYDGIYVEASELNPGDLIETLYTRIPTKGAYCYCKKNPNYYEQYRNLRVVTKRGRGSGFLKYGKWEMTHKSIADSLGLERDGMQVDHIDGDSLNNSPDNLQILSDKENRFKSINRKYDNFGHLRCSLKIIKYLIENNLDYNEDNYENYREKYYKQGSALTYKNLNKTYSYDWLLENLSLVEDKKIDSSLFEDYTPSDRNLQFLVVESIEEYDTDEWVYDISVDKYHNYAAYLGNNTSVYCHNTFSILYGAKVESFADNYCGGDLDHAKSIYDGFYTAYPQVKEWIDARHEEYKKTGRVSTMTNFFIVIAPDGVDNYNGSLSGALRKSQNYPIQASSSAIVGCVLFEVCNYLSRNNMKSKPIMFVHDSIEVDVFPYELIQIVSEFRELLYEVPNNQYGLPSKADFTMGLSIGHELGLKLWEPNEDFTQVHMILEGFQDELEETINNWKLVYDIEVIDTWHDGVDESGNKIKLPGYEPKYIAYNELFVLKRAYNEYVGKTRYEGKIELILRYPEIRRETNKALA